MYYLVDLKEQKAEVFKSKLDLLYYRFSKPEHRPLWWAPDEIIYRMMDFIELNVTGKDIVTGFEKVPGSSGSARRPISRATKRWPLCAATWLRTSRGDASTSALGSRKFPLSSPANTGPPTRRLIPRSLRIVGNPVARAANSISTEWDVLLCGTARWLKPWVKKTWRWRRMSGLCGTTLVSVNAASRTRPPLSGLSAARAVAGPAPSAGRTSPRLAASGPSIRRPKTAGSCVRASTTCRCSTRTRSLRMTITASAF